VLAVKYRKYIYLVLAIVAAAISAGGVFLYLLDLEARTKLDMEYTDVLVARTTIPANEKIEGDMLEVIEIPLAYAHKEAGQSKEGFVGSIARTTIYEGEQVLPGKIVVPGDTADDFLYTLKTGKRALAIAVSEVSGVGGLLAPGNHVDVIATWEVTSEYYTKIIIQNVKVLAINRNYDPLKFKEVTEQANTVTLEVLPEVAPQLALAAQRGTIHLMLRPSGDDRIIPATPWHFGNF
jgi:pilus assembly protein CpaB